MSSTGKKVVSLNHLERDLPLNAADLEALGQASAIPPLGFEKYLLFLSSATRGLKPSRAIVGISEPFRLDLR